MLGLLGPNEKHDISTFIKVFNNSNFKPDMIKIYPTLTIKGTKLYNLWKQGKYKPLDTKKAVKIISQIKTLVPEWVRIQRIQRDVPLQYIDAGVDKSNLRQLVKQEMKKLNLKCSCIRCREIGHKFLNEKIEINKDDIHTKCNYYKASGGDEIFISLENKEHDAIIGYLRLRDIINSHRFELQKKPCMIIRELKVVGRELSIGEKKDKAMQHKGYGKELLEEAERICIEEFDKKYLFVLSGIGVKDYYRKLGFKDDGVYLRKTLI
jgi:elongator complex protein 3